MDRWDVVIVGAGIAGVSAVRGIVEHGGKKVLLLNGEDAVPYKRTRASKKIADGFCPEEFPLESEDWYRENGVTLRNGAVVSALDVDKRTLKLDDGEDHRL